MRDHHRHQTMTDQQLERLVSGLPRRRPSPALRERVLPLSSQRPRLRFRHPLVAWASLVLLLAADVAVLKLQGSGPATVPARPASVAASAPHDTDMLALLDDAGMPRTNRPLLGLAVPGQSSADTYLALRERMLSQPERSPSNG